MPVKSLNSSVLKWPDKKSVDQAVRSWSIDQAQLRPELARLGYFGSYARGNWGVGSDLDLIAVVDAAAVPFERRGLKWDLNILPVPAEILVYTLHEWKKLQKRNDKFARMLNSEVVWTYIRDR
jgi:predicted nucleotidyltransferase